MTQTAPYDLATPPPPAPDVRFDGGRLIVEFGPADFGSPAAYELFKRAKRLPEYEVLLDADGLAAGVTAPARFAPMLGVEMPAVVAAPLPWLPTLFDDQRAICEMALLAKRFACWSDCGLGKSLSGLEWGRQVSHLSLAAGGSGRVLIVTLNEIVPQWIEEAAKFYGDGLPIVRLESREQMRRWCATGMVNAEQVDAPFWRESKDGDRVGYELYRRHYSAKKNPTPKIRQFVGPGEKHVLIGGEGRALWAWRKFIDDSGQQGVNCAVFRNETDLLSSDLIRDAMRIGWQKWPGERFYTYVDPEEIESPNPGYCFKQAGWRVCGETKSGQVILEATPDGWVDPPCLRASVVTRPTAYLAVTNYEKFNHKEEADQVVGELRHLAGIALDESSRLKTGGGKQKWALIKSARGIQYKLSLTATPAPNELMEFASQASFLERMRSESIADATQQIIWTYFTRDPKTHRWTIKQHARAAFFEWMASWSIYVRNPKAFGWRLDWSPPPEPEYFRHEIRMTDEQRQLVMDFNNDPKNVAEANLGSMFAGELNAIAAVKLSQAAKGFIYEKTEAGKAAQADRRGGHQRADKGKGTPVPAVRPIGDGSVREDAGSGADGFRPDDAQHPGDAERSGDGDDEGGIQDNAGGPGRVAAATPSKRRSRTVHSLKPGFVADLIVSEMYAGHQVLVWTIFDEETAILERLLLAHPKLNGTARVKGKSFRTIRDIDTLTGSTSEDDRAQILTDYRAGKCRVLISRASMLGYGMNLQFVGSMIFSGWDFSYEQFYQAIRRAYRHGQEKKLRVHLPVVPELEGQMYDAIVRKQKQHEEAIAEMEANYVRARSGIQSTPAPAEGERAA